MRRFNVIETLKTELISYEIVVLNIVWVFDINVYQNLMFVAILASYRLLVKVFISENYPS